MVSFFVSLLLIVFFVFLTPLLYDITNMFPIKQLISDDGISMAIDSMAYEQNPNARNLASAHRYLSNGRCDIVGATMPALKQAIGPCSLESENALKMEVKFGGRDYDYEAWESTLDFGEDDPFMTEFGSTKFDQPSGSVPLAAIGDQPKAKSHTAIAELEVLEEDPLIGTYMAVARVADRYKALKEDPTPWYETVASWWKIPLSALQEAIARSAGILSVPRTFVACGKRASKLYGLDNYAGKTFYIKEKLTRDHFLSQDEADLGFDVAIDFGWLNAAMEYMLYTSDLARPPGQRFQCLGKVGFGVSFEARTLVKENYYTPVLPDVERYKTCDESLFFNTISIMHYKSDVAKFLARRGVDFETLGLTNSIRAYFQKRASFHVKAKRAVEKRRSIAKVKKKVTKKLEVQELEAKLLEAQAKNWDIATDIAQRLSAAKNLAAERSRKAAKAYAEKLKAISDVKSDKRSYIKGDITPLKSTGMDIHKFPVNKGDAKKLISMIGAVKQWTRTQSSALGLLTADLKSYKVNEEKVAALLAISVKPFFHTATRAVSEDVIKSMIADAPKEYTKAESIAHSLLSRYSKSVKKRLAQLVEEHSKVQVTDKYVTSSPSAGTFLSCISKWTAWYSGKIAGTEDPRKRAFATHTKKALLAMTYNDAKKEVVMPDFDSIMMASMKTYARRSKRNLEKSLIEQGIDTVMAFVDNTMSPVVSFEEVYERVKRNVKWVAEDIQSTNFNLDFNAESRMKQIEEKKEAEAAKAMVSAEEFLAFAASVDVEVKDEDYVRVPWRWEEDFWTAWGHSKRCMAEYIEENYGDEFHSFEDLDAAGIVYEYGLCGRVQCTCACNRNTEEIIEDSEIQTV